MQLIKVTWYVFRVKNMPPGSPSHPSQTATAEVRIRDFKTTWSEFQMPSQTAPAEANPRYVYSILKPHGHNFRCQVVLLLSEAKPSYVCSILNPHGQSFRRPFILLLNEEKPSYIYSILKTHCKGFRSTVILILSEAKPSYVYLILRPHGLNFRSPVHCLGRQSQGTVFVHPPRVGPKQLCALAHLGCTRKAGTS